jgi:hypothetical protein
MPIHKLPARACARDRGACTLHCAVAAGALRPSFSKLATSVTREPVKWFCRHRRRGASWADRKLDATVQHGAYRHPYGLLVRCNLGRTRPTVQHRRHPVGATPTPSRGERRTATYLVRGPGRITARRIAPGNAGSLWRRRPDVPCPRATPAALATPLEPSVRRRQ